jgi:hypothetical protein
MFHLHLSFSHTHIHTQEKINFVYRLARVERIKKSQELFLYYLDMIYELFTTPGLKPEFLGKLQKPFMIGLRYVCVCVYMCTYEWMGAFVIYILLRYTTPSPCSCNNFAYRNKFIALFHSRLPQSVDTRLQHLLVTNWEPLSDSFFLTQGLDLLLSALSPNGKIEARHSQGLYDDKPERKYAGSGATATNGDAMDVDTDADLPVVKVEVRIWRVCL